MHTELLVSIIIPTFNRAHLIGETIQSVLDQGYSNWELIIIDDGSTDDSRTVIDKFNNQRIHYYAIEHCGVLGKVRNAGLHYCKGDYIAFLDSDDLWLPHKLEFQLSLLKEYPQASFVFGHGEQFGTGAISPPELETLFVGNVFSLQLIEERFVLYPSTFLFKRKILMAVGNLSEQFSCSANDFFFRMARKYEGIFYGEKLVRMRKHLQNISKEREFLFYTEHMQMIENFLAEGLLTRKQFVSVLSKLYYKQGLLYMHRGKPGASMKSFLNYNFKKPFNYKGWLRLIQSFLKSIKPNQVQV